MKRIVFLFLILMPFIGSAPSVYPCSCNGYTEREKFRKADYVFLGEVLDIADSNLEYFAYEVKFKIEKQWKGARMAEMVVNLDYDSPGWCGDLNLTKGELFLIYAYRKKEGLVSYTDCGPNLPIEYAGASIKKLNEPMYRFLARLYPF